MRVEQLEGRRLMAADLGVLDDHLADTPALFSAVQGQINDGPFAAEAPLIGSQLQEREAAAVITPVAEALAGISFAEGPVTVADAASQIEGALNGWLTSEVVTQGQDGDTEVRFKMTVGDRKVYRQDDAFDLDLGLGDDSVMDVLLANQKAVDVTLDWTWISSLGFAKRRTVPAKSSG